MITKKTISNELCICSKNDNCSCPHSKPHSKNKTCVDNDYCTIKHEFVMCIPVRDNTKQYLELYKKAINEIDDFFEYSYRTVTNDAIAEFINSTLINLTEGIKDVGRR